MIFSSSTVGVDEEKRGCPENDGLENNRHVSAPRDSNIQSGIDSTTYDLVFSRVILLITWTSVITTYSGATNTVIRIVLLPEPGVNPFGKQVSSHFYTQRITFLLRSNRCMDLLLTVAQPTLESDFCIKFPLQMNSMVD